MKALARSFAGGEITPEMYGRLDLSKYQTGLALCSNFEVLPHGPIDRRPGFRFVNEAFDSVLPVRLIPFAYSATQTMILEFGHHYVRFHTNGQTLLEPNKPIVSIVGNLVTITGHSYVTGEWVFIGNRFFKVVGVNANTFNTTDLWDVVANPGAFGFAARVYTVTTAYNAADLFSIHYAQDSDVLTLTHPLYPSAELRRMGATNWTLVDITFAAVTVIPTGVAAVATIGTAGVNSPQVYVVTTIDADGVTESLASAQASVSNNLALAGNYNTISWTAVTGATRYRVYKRRGGSFGYMGSTTTLTAVDDNVTADTTITPPEDIYTLNTAPGEYPSAVTFHEQRRWFAGTINRPQSVWATRNATLANLTSSLPSQADDALQFRIAAQQQNAIRHLVPLSDLITLTVGGQFRIFADGAPSITPTSLSTKPQGADGASDVQPAITSGSILFVQALGGRIRELAYNFQNAAFVSIDITIMAPHLFTNFTVVDLAYVRAPIPTLWVVRSDGALLGLTYVPEQQVYAWHQHNTKGSYKSVAVVAEGDEDRLYAAIERTINARTVKYIERLDTRNFTTLSDAFYLDSGLTYRGVPISVVSGLWHLEGQTVDVLTDGAVLAPSPIVTGGRITIDDTCSTISVGLGYVSDAQTLPLVLEGTEIGGQFLQKNVSAVALRVRRSSVVQAGHTFDDLISYPARDVLDNYGNPPALMDKEIRFAVSPKWGSDGRVCVRQSAPLPLTLVSLATEVEPGG